MASPAPPPADHRPQGRPGALPSVPSRTRRLAALLACTALVAPCFALAAAPALPQGGKFVAGQGSIGAASGNALTITQTSARGIVDWRSFNIGQGASVTVQNGAGATLNRVTGGDLSQILGSLRATGSLYLVNPQGVVIGSSGVVVTGGRFVASSLDIANDAFMAGGTLVFRGTTDNAEVRNLGNIASTGGDVILISRAVRNEGTITAPRGTAALAAGTEVLLREGPEGHRGMVRVSGAAGDVTNTGRIEAVQAELRAAGGNIYALAGNTAGVIRATGTETRQGRVWLSAGAGTGSGNVITEGRIEARNADGTGGKVSVRSGNAVLNSGTIAADGSSGGAVRVRAARVVQQGTISARGTSGAGGTLRLLADDIALTGAQIDASGASGGGVVRIGGGYRGGEGLPRASTVAADATTAIRADATQRGTGGDVVVWSDNRTDFAGTISARGGAEGGDGGQAEVSSSGVLAYTGNTDLRAPLGAMGTLLLDPYNITISNATQTTGSGFTADANDSVINATVLLNALATANVTVSTGLAGSAGSQAGNITVSAPLDWATSATLTLQAAGGINLNAAITAPAGRLALQAGGTIGATGAITVGRFELLSGNWVQNAATLAGLSAGDFQLTGGTFLRAAGGAGTSGNPWQLTDIFGVQGMATRRSEHYRLANDIAAAGTATWNNGAGFQPIGTAAANFTGSLDGAGLVINGLTINRPTQNWVGLVGYSGSGSTIRNIGLVGGSVTGAGIVGGLVGQNNGTITQAFSTGTVTGGGNNLGGLVGSNFGTISQAYATGAVTATGSGTTVGGLVGRSFASGTISQAYATGSVSGAANVGGLVGWNSSAITRAYATGNVTRGTNSGGLVGFTDGTITESYASGAVIASGAGLAGHNVGTITRSVWDTQTTGRTAQGGTVTNTAGLTTAEARTQTPYTNRGWDFTTGWFQAGDMRPIGRWEAAQPGTDGVRVIRNLNQLQLMATDLGASYRLGADINAAPTNATANNSGIWGAGGFVPVGTDTARFTGSLDGAGRVINGLTINRPTLNNVGLFGWAGGGSTISNIGLVGGSVTGAGTVGGLAGSSGGTIERAFASANVTVSGTGSNGGGLVGISTGTITQAYATGAVTGRDFIGGLIGVNEGTLTQAYATGAVTVTGPTANVGGLIGQNHSTISSSFWDTQTTGRSIGIGSGPADGALGRTTAQLQDITTFRTTYAGWDFDTVWSPPNQVGQNNDATTAFYPQLYSLSNVAAVFVPDASRPYGDANPSLLASYRGLRLGDTISTLATISNPTTATSNVGTYALTASGTTVASPQGRIYRIVHVPGRLTITQRAITVSADARSREYGDANPTLTFQVTRPGGGPALIGTDTLSGALNTTATTTTPVGTIAISRGTLGINDTNYAITFNGNDLTITPRAITVSADARSREYGGANPTLTFQVARAGGGPALVGTDTLSGALATTATETTPVGTVAISRGTLGINDTNYAITFNGNDLTITPRRVIVTAEDVRRLQGQLNPVFTFRTTGLVAGDTPAVIRGLELVSPATATSRPGAYPITPVGGSAANYTLVRLDGTLTVEPAADNLEANDIIGTSNVPPPAAQLGWPEDGIRPIVSEPGAAVPLRAASNECGTGALIGIVRCGSDFASLQN